MFRVPAASVKPLFPAVVAVVGCVLGLGLSAPASATVPADLCSGNPCVVSGAKTVDAGSVLDFGASVELRLAPNATVTVGPGGDRSIEISAGGIVLQPGAAILGGGDDAQVTLVATNGGIELQRSGATTSRIDLSGNSAGSALLQATGDVVIAGNVEVRGSGRDSQGGGIDLAAEGAVTVTGSLLASSTGNGSGGGSIAIAAGSSATVSGTLSTAGIDFGGGEISIGASTGDVSVSGSVNLNGGNPDGSAGTLEIVADGGDVTLAASLTGTAGTGAQEACGDGAVISIEAARDVIVGDSIDVSAGTHCLGGELTVVAGRDVRQQTGSTFKSRGPGIFGGGGRLAIEAEGSVILRQADLTSAGLGGSVEVTALQDADVRGPIDASASGGDGIGGTTFLQACHVTVNGAASLDTRGSFVLAGFGENVLRASGTMTIAGTLRAAALNLLEHKGPLPTISGTVSPAALITFNAGLPDCPPVPECGNLIVDVGEACDDGNTEACDGCSADCRRVDAVCGDAATECGEQCDDGNLEDGDGCESGCTLTPPEGVRVRGTPLETSGCVAQWALSVPNPAIDAATGLPSSRQSCRDGDPGCDADGAVDGVCTFDVQACLRVPDPEIPACSPGGIKRVTIRKPRPPGGSNPINQANAAALADALMALGGKVKAGSTVLQRGPVLDDHDLCSESILLQVEHQPGEPGERTFDIAAKAKGAPTMKRNPLTLACETAAPTCGDGIVQTGEGCDDGNTDACDGCSPSCIVEGCGNGVVECGEECDEGESNGGGDGAACSLSCERLTPELRIPGDGAARFNCALEWSALLNPEDVVTDGKGIPRNSQTCIDNDPACDLDPTEGTCRLRVWACFGGPDERIGCQAHQALGAVVRAPKPNITRAPEVAARAGLEAALSAFSFPAGPGERCTSPIEVQLPVRQRWLEMKLEAPIAGALYKDRDNLRLRCARP